MADLSPLFSSDGFMPHGHCYLWNPALLALHVTSDGLIALAYTSIPFTLVYFARQRKDIPFNWMFFCFGMFIVACGATHVMEIWTIWTPSYWLSGAVKAVTAAASVPTAILLMRLMPKALAIPSVQELEAARAELTRANETLEARIQERTLELTRKTEELARETVEHERAEAALLVSAAHQEADAKFHALLDAAPDAMLVVDEDERITFGNALTETLFGYASSELLGQPLELLIPERFRRAHSGHVAAFFAKPGIRAMGSNLELFARRKDGTEIPIEVSLSATRTERGTTVSAAIRDVSERRRTQAATKLLTDRLASAVESIQDAFALFDGEDRLVLCNSAYRRLIGTAFEGPVVGQSYQELLDAWIEDIVFLDAAERSQFRADRLERRGHDQPTTFDLRMRDGRRLRVTDRRTPEGGTVKTIWDLTEDVRLVEDLAAARSAADRANAAKSEFLSSMSHELRTPLNAILGFSQLLALDKKEPPSPRQRGRLDQIMKGGEHLLRLIDDILDLSRVEAGGISISIEPVNLLEVLEEVQATLAPTATAASVELELVATDGVPMVAVDRTRLAQIFMNFGSNGVKYNRPDGKVTFTVSVPEPDRVRVVVSDEGIGIPEDKQGLLFQPFQRAGQETGPIQGTGIGLAITKRLAELMGGSVGFRSVHGQGSEFWVEVPTHSSGSQSTRPPSFRLANPRLREESRGVVLYVEDNPANVAFMRDLLGSFENIELLVASNAEQGLDIARARRPSVVIIDINLPGMSGIDALRVLRTWPETAPIPVLALTAAASERDQRQGQQAGFHRYLTKPLKVEELEAALLPLLE